MARSCLLTGASGLVGSHLRPRLEAAGWVVHAPSRAALDLARPFEDAQLPAAVDAIVHLAQSPRYRDFPAGAPEVFLVNTAATARLIAHAEAAGARHFVLASTGSVYAPSALPLHESSPIATSGYYAASKRAAEILIEPYAARLAVTCFRFFFVYGPGQASTMLLPRLIESVRSGRAIQLQGEDGVVGCPLHAEDAASAILAALEAEGSRTLNCAGPEALSLGEIARAIGEVSGRAPVFEHQGGVAPRLVPDLGALEATFGLPARRLADALPALALPRREP